MRQTQVRFTGWEVEGGSVSFSPASFEVRSSGGKIIGYGYGKGSYHCAAALFTGMSLAISAEPRPGMFSAAEE